MRTVINRMSQEIEDLSFWAVHDSFGTHAVSIGKMQKTIIESFWEMHEGRDINWWLANLEGPEGKMSLEFNKLKIEQTSNQENSSERRKSERSEYLVS